MGSVRRGGLPSRTGVGARGSGRTRGDRRWGTDSSRHVHSIGPDAVGGQGGRSAWGRDRIVGSRRRVRRRDAPRPPRDRRRSGAASPTATRHRQPLEPPNPARVRSRPRWSLARSLGICARLASFRAGVPGVIGFVSLGSASGDWLSFRCAQGRRCGPQGRHEGRVGGRPRSVGPAGIDDRSGPAMGPIPSSSGVRARSVIATGRAARRSGSGAREVLRQRGGAGALG